MKATIFDGKTVRPYTADDARALSSTTPYAWIDVVTDGDDPEVLALLKQMGFTEIVAAYTTRTYSSGMFQVFGENMLGSTFAAADHEQDPPVLIHCLWNSGCFVTVRRGADKALERALRDIKTRSEELFGSPGPVPGILMQLILDSLDRQLTSLQTEIGLLDGEIIVTSHPKQLTQLQQLRTTVEALGTTIPTYSGNIRESLVDPSSLPGIDSAGVHALQTYAACVTDVEQRVVSVAANIRSAIQDYESQVSTAQGNRINQLTVVSIIFLPISFLTGYFGMNFQYLVNETMSAGAWVGLGVLLPVACVVLSVVLLRRGGFHVNIPLRFRVRHEGKDAPAGQGK
jgi:Mg2+ and Co2+ transporter CorA